MKCTHVAMTVVNQFVNKDEQVVSVHECDMCGRVFQVVDGKTSRNYPALSYLSLAF